MRRETACATLALLSALACAQGAVAADVVVRDEAGGGVSLSNEDTTPAPAARPAESASAPAAKVSARTPATVPMVPASHYIRAGVSKLPLPGASAAARKLPKSMAEAQVRKDGQPNALQQHRATMLEQSTQENYSKSNTAVSRRYLMVDKATFEAEQKAQGQ